MPAPAIIFDEIKPDYTELWNNCEIKKDMLDFHNRLILANVKDVAKKTIENVFLRYRNKYDQVELATSVPWWFIACVHRMEGSSNFNIHLHNGDPLTSRTRRVPKGRPEDGNPPFTWEHSAIDAITMKDFDQDWSIERTLFKLETYNGFGYRRYHPEVKSPYLWSGTTCYTSGKYVGDGQFDPMAVSKQIGCSVFLKLMEQLKIISFK